MANKGYSTYYHHTDRNSVDQILESGVIRQSDIRQDDAAFGSGTYLTKVGPYSSRLKVAQNNYDGMTNTFWQSKMFDGKTDAAIALKLPKASVHPCAAGDRDVHLYEGDLRLDEAKKVDVYVRGRGGIQKYSHK